LQSSSSSPSKSTAIEDDGDYCNYCHVHHHHQWRQRGRRAPPHKTALDMEVAQEQPVIRRSEDIQIRVGVGVGVVVSLPCEARIEHGLLMTSVRCQGGVNAELIAHG
jgi:hypothetical protein